MLGSLRDLYGHLTRASQKRMKLSLVGLLLGAGLEVLGLALILPLMQIFAGDGTSGGLLGVISRVLGHPGESELALMLAGIVFVTFIVKGMFMLAFRWWVLGYTNRQAADVATDLFERYLYAPYSFHLTHNTAELIRTITTGVGQAYLTVINGVLAVLAEAVTVLAVGAALLLLRPGPALAIFAYFTVVGYVFQKQVRTRASAAGQAMQSSAWTSTRAALQGLGGVKELSVRWAQPHFTRDFADSRMTSAMATRTSLMLGETPRYALEMLFIVGVAIMSAIVFTSGDSASGAATLGLFVAAGFRMMPSLVRILAALSSIRVGMPGVDLVLADLAELPPAPVHVEVGEPLGLSSNMAVRDLCFSYDDSDKLVLDGVSFDLPAGESLAIVGSSGAGKTTLVDIILGLHNPTSGQVTVDGTDIAEVLPRWQRSIGLVPQDVYLLDDSLRANIAFGEKPEDIDEERLTEAIARAQLDELVQELPEGLDTFVGERGVRLSGGQRQRIGIARALYLRPQLLVLDEATSALDNETERRITSTIEALHGEMTIIVVAHRLSTVRRCDKLLFMSQGKLETQGTFDEVRVANPTFAHLVELGSLDTLESHGDVPDGGRTAEAEQT